MQAHIEPCRGGASPERGAASPGVLLLGQARPALQALADRVQATLPQARIEMLSSTTDLVFRLAGQDVSIVIVDSAHLDETPPSLLSLSRGASGTLQLAFIGAPDDAPQAMHADALPAWLRRACARTRP